MIELLTPTGVAKADSEDHYAGSYPVWFSEVGVRMTLVDAHPGRFDYNGNFQGFTASVSAGNGYYTTFACDNNKIERSCFKTYKLIEIIPSDGVAAKYLSGQAKNEDLFHAGDKFNTDFTYGVHAKDGKRGKLFPYSVEITSMGEDECVVNIVKQK